MVPLPVLLAVAIGGLVLLAWLLRQRPWRQRTPRAPLSLLGIVRNNEAEVEGFVRILAGFAQARGADLVVVDDASTDATQPILERLARQCSGLRICRREADAEASALEIGYFLCAHATVLVVPCPVDHASLRALRQTLCAGGHAPAATHARQ